MLRKEREKRFLNKLKSIHPNIEVLSTYTNSKTKILLVDRNCGSLWLAQPQNILTNKGCPYCNKSFSRKNTSIFKKEIYNLVGEEYWLKEGQEYKGYLHKLVFVHSCGREFLTTPSSFLQGRRCSCKNPTRKRTHEEFETLLNQKFPGEYKILSKYKNSETPIKVKHLKCGHIFYPRPANILNRTGCPNCSRLMETAIFQERLDERGDGVRILKRDKDKLLLKHKCGNIWKSNIDSVIYSNSGCPLCNTKMSKGAQFIELYLKRLNLNYKLEHSFDDCRFKSLLYFDFAIKLSNKIYLIEYDGLQHFKPAFNMDRDDFLRIRLRDKVKDKYCIKNNIPLLRLNYKDNDIDVIRKINRFLGISASKRVSY